MPTGDGEPFQPMAFERLDQVGHSFGHQKINACHSPLSHMDAGFDSCSRFVQRPVICEFPLNKKQIPLLYSVLSWCESRDLREVKNRAETTHPIVPVVV